ESGEVCCTREQGEEGAGEYTGRSLRATEIGGRGDEAAAAVHARIGACESAAERLRPGAELCGHLPLAQHSGTFTCRVAREGRARRLLDLLVHQLSAHASAPRAMEQRVPLEGARDRRRP